jgi:hypothetical protein
MSRYPFGECLLLHFTNVDIADRTRNIELLNKIEETFNSNADAEVTDKIRLNIARGYLQRQLRKISPPSQESPLFIGNTDFIMRDLLITTLAYLWSRSGLSFQCLNPHYHSRQEMIKAHLR